MTEIKKIKLPEYYDSIDTMPMLNWNRVHETGEMKWLLVRIRPISDEQKSELAKIWSIVYEEYINAFGFSELYKTIVSKKVEIAKLKIQAIVTEDGTIENFISRTKRELSDIENSGKGGDINKCKIMIEQKLGFRIPLKEVTVREFYNYLKFANQKK